MKSFDAHLADCRTLLARRPPVRVPALDSVGLELAEPVVATAPYPAFAVSAMDGFAVRVDDVPGRLRIAGEVAAGRVPTVEVAPGSAVRIMTGSPIPVGTEAVVRVEDTVTHGDDVEVSAPARHGLNIREVGEDVQAGDVVLPAGQVIAAAQIAALAAHNVDTVSAYPRVRVGILSTGDEIVSHGSVPGPAQLVDSNGPGLAAAAIAAGADVVHVAHVSDQPDRFLAAMDALPELDQVITSGGISMGAYDVVKASLASRGVQFQTVAMQPGKPQAWGRYQADGGTRPPVSFLGLPGNPVSALMSFELFGRAALGRELPIATATLLDPVERSPDGKRQFLRGRLADGTVRLVSGAESHLVVGLARANCLVVVSEDIVAVPAGAQVPVIVLAG
ncbi:MAG TPA: gephyrin-like molybdotransferase Glp [Mycobacteriales bacterium]|nr:gephyrin-like molybdotransferase Glp [Mycobacteriales bacterium]